MDYPKSVIRLLRANETIFLSSFRFAKKKKGKQKVLSLQKVNQRREVNYCVI